MSLLRRAGDWPGLMMSAAILAARHYCSEGKAGWCSQLREPSWQSFAAAKAKKPIAKSCLLGDQSLAVAFGQAISASCCY